MATPTRKVARAGGIRGYLASTRSHAVGTVVTLPLLLLYNVGLLMPGADEMNAVDLLSRLVVRYGGWQGMLILNGVLVLLSIGLVAWLARKGRFHPKWWWALMIEGLAYGFLLGHGVTFVMDQAHLLAAGATARSYSIPQALSMAAGAGYWEELVFRLAMVGGPIAIARKWGKGGTGQVVWVGFLAVVVSSVIFSVAHYVGGMESPEWFTFWYRALSGVVFSVLFLVRGFAVATWTHFLYDVVVMVF
jgi:hypothetical protein